MKLNQYPYYLALDLEATCCDRNTIKRHQMEMIEIGAVMVERDRLNVVGEFQTFVKPTFRPLLTAFCTRLTTITQDQVDAAPPFPRACEMLRRWLDDYPGYLFGSWGDYDKLQFKADCRRHNHSYPFKGDHLNLKKQFSRSMGTKKKLGMKEALEHVGLPLKGTHHRGIDDARNLVDLLPFILGRASHSS